jgi:hypothetical protein
MSLDHDAVPMRVSLLLDRRPVRWGKVAGDYDGRERTLEIFATDMSERRELLRKLRPVRAELDAAAGGPIVILFHTRAESRRLYADVIDAWHRKVLAALVAAWITERSDSEPLLEVEDIEPFRVREAA